MLDKSPDRRPQTPGEVAKTLSRFASGSDLQELVSRTDESLPSTRPLSLSVAATPQPWLRRPVPRSLAIACGFFGILFGLMLGMFIKIKYPDGTEVTLPLTPGTSVEVVSEDAVNNSASEAEMPRALPKTNMPAGINAATPQVNRAELIIAQLQGIWQLESRSNLEQTVLAYFDGFYFCVVTVSKDVEEISFGDIVTQWDGRDMTIFLNFSSPQTIVQLTLLPPEDVQHSFWVRVNPARNSVGVLGLTKEELGRRAELQFTRVGSLPKTPADLQSLLGDNTLDPNDPYVKGLKMLAQARDIGPKQMHEAMNKTRVPAEIVRSMNNLKQIGLGFHTFHDAYDHFPGSTNVLGAGPVKDGKEIQPFSWRVAILPYIGQNELFESYRFSEAWNSVHNLSLLDKMPEIYRSPRAPADQPKGHTNYLGITTEGALMEKKDGRKMSDITDGTANTILVVESKKTVLWTSPEDLSEYPEFFSPAIYVMADGRPSNENPDPDQIKKMITINGGEQL